VGVIEAPGSNLITGSTAPKPRSTSLPTVPLP